uniref:ubiquitinyl hydrolase 1 n=1 Tax=Sphenodon punctatus TaxID=8508 RepID=A0A8D0L6L3_SPHPU
MRPSRRLFIAVNDFAGEAKVPRGSLLSQEEAHGSSGALENFVLATVLDTGEVVRAPGRALRELSNTQVGLLEAVTNGEERLALFRQERLLRRLSTLRKGDPVRVQITSASGERVRGIIRYRGPVGKSKDDTSIVFGVELVGSAAEKGFTDGSFKGQKFFSCRENCGVFVPANRIEPDDLSEDSPLLPPTGSTRDCRRLQLASGDPLSSPGLELGDRVFFQMGETTPTGTVMYCDFLPRKEEMGTFVGIRLDEPIGSWDGRFKEHVLCRLPSPQHGILLPISKVHKEKIDDPEALIKGSTPPSSSFLEEPLSPASIRYPPRMERHSPKGPPSSFPSMLISSHEEKEPQRNEEVAKEKEEEEEEEEDEEQQQAPLLEINSMVEVNDPPMYGVIRWIGELPDVDGTIAGLELEEPLPSGCTDGHYRGARYFYCQSNKALFVRLRHCRPDSRFDSLQSPEDPVPRCNSLAFKVYASARVEEDTPPPPLGEEGRERLSGWKKGIQGHCNSCYLDTTLFW